MGQNVDAPDQNVDAARRHVDASSRRVDLTSRLVVAPTHDVDGPGKVVDAPTIDVDPLNLRVDLPTRPVDGPMPTVDGRVAPSEAKDDLRQSALMQQSLDYRTPPRYETPIPAAPKSARLVVLPIAATGVTLITAFWDGGREPFGEFDVGDAVISVGSL